MPRNANSAYQMTIDVRAYYRRCELVKPPIESSKSNQRAIADPFKNVSRRCWMYQQPGRVTFSQSLYLGIKQVGGQRDVSVLNSIKVELD
jgi:hypothetical protein